MLIAVLPGAIRLLVGALLLVVVRYAQGDESHFLISAQVSYPGG